MTRTPRPPRIVRWLSCAEQLLGEAAPRLNALNVFPVPDADTGSNMHATMAAAHAAVAVGSATDIGAVLQEAGAAALSCARGNSGTLLAVMLAGMADALRGREALTAPALAEALVRADTAAHTALSDPREGTILSVLTAGRVSVQATLARAEAESRPAQTRAVLEEAVVRAVQDAHEAVRRTQGQLEELTRAAVVDAGALGLLLVFEALRCVVLDVEPDPTLAADLSGYAEGAAAEEPSAEGGVEVMCTIELDPLGAATLRHRLTEVGDSVIVAPTRRGEDPQDPVPWRVHVHVPEAPLALDLFEEAGEPQDLAVTALDGGHQDDDGHHHDHDHDGH